MNRMEEDENEHEDQQLHDIEADGTPYAVVLSLINKVNPKESVIGRVRSINK